MPDSPPKASSSKWLHPNQVLQLHRLKAKKKALQARIQARTAGPNLNDSDNTDNANDATAIAKRRNPFLIEGTTKRQKFEPATLELEDTSDQTLFKLLRLGESSTKPVVTDFNNVLQKISAVSDTEKVQIVKAKGESWLPVDWALKTRIRFLSSTPFHWNQKLKISEEASGVTSFARCLDPSSTSPLDTSPNAKFHQCCLFWQQPFLPWISLFPRTRSKAAAAGTPLLTTPVAKEALQSSWADGFRSVFQLLRTKQCPYFYVCANTFTVLFRAGGICGFTEMHAMITPTTRGLRQLLRQEEIEFVMPLKNRRLSDHGYETADSTLSAQTLDHLGENEVEDEEEPDDAWMQSMGLNAEDIRQINYTQNKIANKVESKVDYSEESLVLLEGMEVHALYNFLLNYRSTVSITGHFAGIPPTILAPVAFHGATLNSLRVREGKVHVDDADYYSLDVMGPILPTTIHNLCLINPPDSSFTATFSNVASTIPLSKINKNCRGDSDLEDKTAISGSAVFGKENLSDCGLNSFVLKRFCCENPQFICNVECLKYTGDTKTFTWT